MPDYNGSIIVVKGNALRVNRTVSLLPGSVSAPQTATKAWLTIKVADDDLDSDPTTVQKSITATATVSGQLIDTDGTDGIAILAFVLANAETLGLSKDSLYFYSIRVLMSGGDIYTPEKGRLLVKIDETLATS